MRRTAALMLAAVAVSACGRGAHDSVQGDDAGDDAMTSDDGGFSTDGAPGEGGLLGDGGTASNCATGADLVYVVSEERQLYSFDPKTTTFTLLGSVDCANGSYVNSMAVDRSAVAWINYGDGSLWKVDTQHLPTQCQATGYVPNQQNIALFGMGFSAKSPGASAETLFICDLTGGGLGFIDLSKMQLERLGPFQGAIAGRACELTGTGDARLFGFFAGSPLGDAGSSSVDQIDPATEAATQSYALPTVDTGTDWAFSFWGGDFYLFTADKYNQSSPDSIVTRFRPSDGSVTNVPANLTFRIVGAGSSTCAPTTSTQ